MEILSPTPENIERAAKWVLGGQPLAIPTETVYGLAAPASNDQTIGKVYSIKGRPKFDPLIVHVNLKEKSLDELMALGLLAPEVATYSAVDPIIKTFWPGPLTLVLPKSDRVSDLVTAGLKTVAIRFPAHPIAQDMIKACGEPLAAPSANLFGQVSPTSAQAVAKELDQKIPAVLDGGDCEIGIESTVVAVSQNEIRILRHGKITAKDIEEVSQTQVSVQTGKKIEGPGMTKRHYSPGTPMELLPDLIENLSPDQIEKLKMSNLKVGLITLQDKEVENFAQHLNRGFFHRSLSRKGDWEEIARNLFSTIRSMDEGGFQIIFCEPCLAEEGLGYAIRDRLDRATAQGDD